MREEITLENYEKRRQELLAANQNLLGIVLREDEERADQVLAGLKAEFAAAFDGMIPYSMPVLTEKRLRESRLYEFCSKMPKGADLHVHDLSLLPVKDLIRLLMKRPEICIHANHTGYDLIIADPKVPVPQGYLRFREAIEEGIYETEELIRNWTVIGAKKAGMTVWDYFELLFARHACLSDNPDFAADYYDYTFRYYCQKNIMHVEIHLMLTETEEASLHYVETIREAYYRVKKDFPYFTVRIIGAGVKQDNEDMEMSGICFRNTAYVQQRVRDESDPDAPMPFVIGFDLVNEEDRSRSLHDFVPMLFKAKEKVPEMKFYIHGGESLDAGNENLIDAYLLGVSRVGHGLNLYRYPDLHRRYADAEICLEVCPISNQSLGYTKDIRNHPVTEYLRTGVPIALCSDDPTYMENETLTDDFFAGVVCWNLGLAELKQLAVNSIQYSGLTKEEKTKALRAFKERWNLFIKEVLE